MWGGGEVVRFLPDFFLGLFVVGPMGRGASSWALCTYFCYIIHDHDPGYDFNVDDIAWIAVRRYTKLSREYDTIRVCTLLYDAFVEFL